MNLQQAEKAASMTNDLYGKYSRANAARVMSPYTTAGMWDVGSIKKREATVLFADICGYTTLMEQDELTAHMLTTNTLRYIEYAALEAGGVVREHAGDRLFIEFAAPQTAVSFAFRIAMKKFSWPALATFDTDRIRLRIGIHNGKVLDIGSGIRGKVVIMAARLQEVARLGGIAITQKLLSALDTQVQSQFHFRCCRPLKNITEHVSIYDSHIH